MNHQAIVLKIKEIIADVAEIEVADISDTAAFVEDLDLDSLTHLEIGADVNYAFTLGLTDDTLQQIRSVPDAVKLIQEHLQEREAQGGVA